MGVNCLIIRLLHIFLSPHKTVLIAGNSKIQYKNLLSQDNQQPSIYDTDYHNEGSTTIPKGSTSQANGDGNALPTNNSSEDIV